MTALTTILAKYPLAEDLRRQLSEELAGMERDASRWNIASRASFLPIAIVNGDMDIVEDVDADVLADDAIAKVSQ